MAENVTLRNSVDTYVTPTARGGASPSRLFVNSTARAYVFFSLPILPPGAVIVSATLRGQASTDPSNTGLHTIVVKKLLTPFDPNSLVWGAAEPGIGATVDSKTHPWNQPWFFDVTSTVVDALAGGNFFGWQLSSPTAQSVRALYGGRTGNLSLSIQYATRPPAPVDLTPNNDSLIQNQSPTLLWSFGGYQGSAVPLAFEVQVGFDPTFVTNFHDSGTINSQSASYDLNAAGVEFNVEDQIYWRVRVQSTDGAWSPWSEGAHFYIDNAGSLEIVSPGAVTPDPTPEINWSFSGDQIAYRVELESMSVFVQPMAYREIYDSGILYGSIDSFTIPVGVITRVSDFYRVRVRVWTSLETVAAVQNPNDFVQEQDFIWTPSGATPPVDLQILPAAHGPHRVVRWQYTGPSAERFAIYRTSVNDPSNVQQTIVNAIDVWEGGASTWYRYTDRLIRGRSDVTWEVQTLRAGQSSSFNPAVTRTVRNRVPWITSVYDENKIFNLVNYDIDPGLSEISDVVVPVVGNPYLVQQSLQGFVGSASGTISWDTPEGVSAQDMINSFLWIRENPRAYMVWQDQAIECFIYNCAFVPVGRSDGKTDYDISFNFVEV